MAQDVVRISSLALNVLLAGWLLHISAPGSRLPDIRRLLRPQLRPQAAAIGTLVQSASSTDMCGTVTAETPANSDRQVRPSAFIFVCRISG